MNGQFVDQGTIQILKCDHYVAVTPKTLAGSLEKSRSANLDVVCFGDGTV